MDLHFQAVEFVAQVQLVVLPQRERQTLQRDRSCLGGRRLVPLWFDEIKSKLIEGVGFETANGLVRWVLWVWDFVVCS